MSENSTGQAADQRKWMELYRRYRPIQLSDVVGQTYVVQSLSNSAKRNSFNHAYLLAGAYGSGKTSFARILASLMVCPNRKPGSNMVCGKCKYCVGIHNGYCVDVMELDGGNQTGVDEARELKKSTAFTPQELKKKIYIIDECHKLSPAANSALLKVLEEPPPYVHFIFCTTDSHKMLPTIISRCQKHMLSRIPSKLVAERLEKVAAREGILVEKGVCQQLARLAGGSLRDALGNLEQVAMFTAGDVKAATVGEYFGIPSTRVAYSIVSMMTEQNVSGMLMKVNDLIVSCIDPKEILVEVSNVLRNIHVLKYCGKDANLIDVDDEEMATIEALAAKFSEKSLMNIATSLGKIENQITMNINERWIVEAALVNCVLTLNNDEQSSRKSGKQ